jgi:hypothetical protein
MYTQVYDVERVTVKVVECTRKYSAQVSGRSQGSPVYLVNQAARLTPESHTMRVKLIWKRDYPSLIILEEDELKATTYARIDAILRMIMYPSAKRFS